MIDEKWIIKQKIVDEIYAFHGKGGIESLISMIRDEIFSYIENQNSEYFENFKKELH